MPSNRIRETVEDVRKHQSPPSTSGANSVSTTPMTTHAAPPPRHPAISTVGSSLAEEGDDFNRNSFSLNRVNSNVNGHHNSNSNSNNNSPLNNNNSSGTYTRSENNLKSVMDFIGRLSVASSKEPKMSLEVLLDTFGYVKDEIDSSDDDEFSGSSDSKSMSSIAFNFGSPSTDVSAASFSPLRNISSILTRFSSELAHRCWIENNPQLLSREQQEARAAGWKPKKAEAAELAKVMVPWRGEAAILFIDLSGYSKISSALTDKGGAHALSAAVNLYFESLLAIVATQFQGSPGFFAGDAVCCFWPCSSVRKPIEVCVAACACALELQRRAGSSKVEGTDLTFGIHCSVSFGDIESTVFSTVANENNQSAYHFVSGFPLEQTSILLGSAKIGQCVISTEAYDQIKSLSRTTKIELEDHVVKEGYLLNGLDDEFQDILDNQVTDLRIARSNWLEKSLVPVTIASKLRQGFKAAHIAEMRFLCVLFVRKNVDSVSPQAWFYEVHQILDECRCPIVQILHDDKGTHLVAAVGLYHTEKSPATTGILAARKLWERDTGSVVGVACGDVFCGITGSEVACRWDITGPACVRAARLMQHGVEKNLPVVVDASVAGFTEDDSQLEARGTIHLKGSPIPTNVYTLVDETVSVTAGISSMKWSSKTLHLEQRTKLADELISRKYQRGVALVSGPVGAGKKTLITILMGTLHINSITHYATRDKTPLCIMATLADWFSHHLDPELARLGAKCRENYNAGKITQTLNCAHQAINRFIEKDLVLVFVVSYIHLLDKASVDFIKNVSAAKPTPGRGRFLFILTCYPLWGYPSPKELEEEFSRPLKENERMKKLLPQEKADLVQTDIIKVHIPYSTDPAVFADSFRGTTFWYLRDHASAVLAEATGGCLMLIEPMVDICRSQYLEQYLQNKNGELDRDKCFMVPLADGTLELSETGFDFFMSEVDWKRVAPRANARFLELYDALPPRLQLVLRVIASLATTSGNAIVEHVGIILKKLNSKLTVERISRDIELLKEAEILTIPKDDDGEEVCFAVPAMIDTIVSLLTPEQDRILKRYAFTQAMKFYDGDAVDGRIVKAIDVIPSNFYPIFCSFIARLARAAGEKSAYQKLMKEAWERVLEITSDENIAKYEAEKKEREENQQQEQQLDPLHDPRDSKTRLEERLSTENRRFPNYCPPDLFAASSSPPHLSRMKSKIQEEIERTPLLPNEVLFQVDFIYPMALGPIGGELQYITWIVANNVADFTRGERVLAPQEFRKLMTIDMDLLIKSFKRADEMSPPLTEEEQASIRPLEAQLRWSPRLGMDSDFDSFTPFPATNEGYEAERKFLEEDILAKPASYEDSLKQMRLLRAYYFKMILPRRDRAVFHQRNVYGEDFCLINAKRDCVQKSYKRLLIDNPKPVDVHHCLMDLTTGNFRSHYFNINLEMIRDQVLRRHNASCEDFKAYLAYLVEFGSEITPRAQFSQVSDHLTK